MRSGSDTAENPQGESIPRTKKKATKAFLIGSPKGTRTPVTTVKGWCLNHLTIGPYIGSGGENYSRIAP